MAEIEITTIFKTFTLTLTDNEMEQVLECSAAQQFSILEMVQAAFKIGLIQLVAKNMRDQAQI